MGFSASQGSADNTGDETVAFDLPPTCAGIVLPVTLVQLKASAAGNSIKVTWKTEEESNNGGFELQRKSSLTEPFVTIATIAAKGNGGGAAYDFDDKNVLPNILYYYQLVQKDKDGRKSFSPVVTAMVQQHLARKISIYPNPAKTTVSLQCGEGFENIVTLKIADIFGRVVYTKVFNNISNSRVVVDVSTYAAGMYTLRVDDKTGREVFKIIKH